MKALIQFQTKKRSSRPLWIFWLLFFTFISAVGATLTVSELFLLSNQRVVYTGIRGANIEDRRVFSVKDEAFLDGKGPVFFFGQHEIIVGTAKSITAPSPQTDVLLIKRENWDSVLLRKILANPSLKKLFPANNFGIIYSKKAEDTFGYNDLLALGTVMRQLNKAIESGYSQVPVPYFLSLRSGVVGVN